MGLRDDPFPIQLAGMRIHLIAVNEKMVAVKDGAFEPGLMEQHLQHALATARYIAGNVSTQLMLKTLFEIIATMADDPDKYRSDVRKKLLELADTMPLAPMPATREKKVRGFVKETVGNLLINQQLVIDHRFA